MHIFLYFGRVTWWKQGPHNRSHKKWMPKGSQRQPKWSQKGAKGRQCPSQNTLCGAGAKQLGKGFGEARTLVRKEYLTRAKNETKLIRNHAKNKSKQEEENHVKLTLF